MDTLLRLYPLPAQETPLVGAFLQHDLRQNAVAGELPYVYSNFITSLDGRIAIPRPTGAGFAVPKDIANERDWRLFQELAAQAGIIISSGRYLRDWAAGRAQEILRIDDERFEDLRRWRRSHGLPDFPDIAIISASLDFPIPPVLTAAGRKVVVFTIEEADAAQVRAIEAQGVPVFKAGSLFVDGRLLAQRLGELGYRTVYSAAGPKVLHLLVSAGVLRRLYLTFANRLLAGQPFSSILEGTLLNPSTGLKVHHIYLDPLGLDGLGQLFVSYDVISSHPSA